MPIGPRMRDDMFVSLPVVETDLDYSSSPTPNPLYMTVEAPSKSALDRERECFIGGFGGVEASRRGATMGSSLRNRGSMILLGLLVAGTFSCSDLAASRSPLVFDLVASVLISRPW